MKERHIRLDERGAVAPTVALSLIMLLGFGALTIDVGNALIARNELQDVADAAALAGARQLGVLYAGGPNGNPPPMTSAQQQGFTLTDPSLVLAAVQEVSAQNTARGVSIGVNAGDIQIGDWDSGTRTLTVTTVTPNAVRVTARRDPGANGPITTFLASVVGITSLNVTATATAALTGVSTTAPGELETPFGISAFRMTTPFCNAPVKFYPTNDPQACGGWHTFTDTPPNANRLRNIINQLIPDPPTYVTPGTQAGDTTLEFVGGNIANALKNLYNLYLSKRDPNTGFWDALVPVYQSNDCSNPTTPMVIAGYASMRITNVLAPPAGQLVEGIIQCDLVDGGRGGGASYGTLGSIPGLVE